MQRATDVSIMILASGKQQLRHLESMYLQQFKEMFSVMQFQLKPQHGAKNMLARF